MLNELKKIIPVSVKDYLKKRVTLLTHRGNTYVCPLCGYSAKDLAVIGQDYPVITEKQIIGAGRRFGACHNCGSTERERHIFLYLKENLKLFTERRLQKVLHIAPEKALTTILYKAGFSEYVCGDLINNEYMENYPEYITKMDVRNIPYPENYFDVIICSHVLEHIPDDIAAMKELFRVLNPNGTAILQVPISLTLKETYEDFTITSPEERGKAFGQTDHVRIYGQDYTQRLSEAGFVPQAVNLFDTFPRAGLLREEDIFTAAKITVKPKLTSPLADILSNLGKRSAIYNDSQDRAVSSEEEK